MVISILTICLFILYNLFFFAEDGLLGEAWTHINGDISYVIITPAIAFCIVSFLLLHIIMLYKYDAGKKQDQEDLINMIGQVNIKE